LVQIIGMVREAEVHLSQGKSIKLVSREPGIAEQTCYCRSKEYGGMKVSQARRLKELEQENTRLKRAVADLTLETLVLKEALVGKLLSLERRRRCVFHLRKEPEVSDMRSCRVVTQPRSTQRFIPKRKDAEEILRIERWRQEYNTFRPHSSLNYRPPDPEAILTTWIVNTDQGALLPLPGRKDTLPLP